MILHIPHSSTLIPQSERKEILVDNARYNRDMVSDRLTPAQLAQAQELATRCFESDFQDCE